jgi:uncharacterized protein (DUF1501 family)
LEEINQRRTQSAAYSSLKQNLKAFQKQWSNKSAEKSSAQQTPDQSLSHFSQKPISSLNSSQNQHAQAPLNVLIPSR